MDELKLKNIKLNLVKPGSLRARRLEPHIRRNRASKHPSIIIGEDGQMYLFLSMTSHPIKNTVKLSKNPNPDKKK